MSVATTTHVDIGAMIWRMPCPTGDRPCISGTGLSVKCIAGWHTMGFTPEQILMKYSHVSLAQIYAALAYYHANRKEIDSAMAADERAEREGVAASRTTSRKWYNELKMRGVQSCLQPPPKSGR